MKFPEYDETVGKIANLQKKLSEIFEAAGPEMDMTKVKGYADSAEAVAAIRTLNEELTELGQKRDDLSVVKAAAERAKQFKDEDFGHEAGDGSPAPARAKSFGEQFVASNAYKVKGQKVDLDVDVKTLFARNAGWAPESTRSGLVVDFATRPIQVTDVIPSIPTGQAAYKYMEETTFTNAAAERAEAGPYGEAALALTERSVTVETVGVWLPVTDEQLEDEAGAAAYIDQRLPFMVRQRLDSQLLVGDGNTPNIRGVNNVVSIQTEAKGANTTPDAIHRGITKVRVTGRAMPNAIIMHPNDWQDIRLLRTLDGIYIWGSPSDPGAATIWGLSVVQTDAQTENTAVVGDFANYSLLAVRRGIEVLTTNSHDTNFINGRQAVRASIRAAAVWTRPAAFCTVTGI